MTQRPHEKSATRLLTGGVFPYVLILLLLFAGGTAALAQEPTLAPDDLDFSWQITEKYHFAAWVTLQSGPNLSTKYQYDRYPHHGDDLEVERIKTSEASYVRATGKPWMRSDDWGRTGTPVSADQTPRLNLYASVVTAQLAKPEDLDSTQGGPVWKFIAQTQEKNCTYYTYERSREHPRPGGVYPRFTFMKAAADTDGKLFLCMATGQMRQDNRRIPFVVHLAYLVPLPAGAKVTVTDPATGQQKLQTVVGDNSGWEISSQQSTPPPGP